MAAANPRIQEARSRAASVKRAIAFVSVAGFLAAFVLARAGHPGNTSAVVQPAPSLVTPVTGESSDDEGGSLGFGSASIAPPAQNVAPSVQTHTS